MVLDALRFAVVIALAGCAGAVEAPARTPGGGPAVAAPAPRTAALPPAPSSPSGSIRDVVAGGLHTCAIDGQGRVLCWGDNRKGQVGDGTFVTRAAPTIVAGLAPARALALGEEHTCALHDDGTVSCWGGATVGAIGVAAAEDRPTPRPVPDLRGVVAIAAGASHTCALRDDGRVTCWGDDDRGQLGLGRISAHEPPTEVPALRDVVQITAAATATCARTRAGTTACFGENTMGQLGLPHDRAVPGTVVREDPVGWADGRSGGHRIVETRWLQTRPVVVAPLAGASRVALGPYVVCAVLDTGAVRCLGNNLFGQLGVSDRALTTREVPEARGATALTVGGFEVCVLKGGRAMCWGETVHDEEPNATVADLRGPTTLPDVPAGVLGVSAGDRHACAFTAGSVHCWGNNDLEQLGIGVVVNGDVDAVAGIDATQISVGVAHGCGLRRDGTVACWTEQDPVGNAPAAMPVRGVRDAVRVVSGGHHACAIHRDGQVDCFAAPKIDEYGGGQVTPPGPARRIAGLANVVDLALGPLSSCALDAGGAVSCWDGDFDALALTPGPPPPVVARPIAGIVAEQVVVGVGFGCARTRERTVQCWSDPRIPPPASPAELADLRGVVSLAAGGAHVCALLEDGTVRCWGDNREGQLGDGSTVRRGRPVRVAALEDVIAISASSSHTCALRRGGRVACWGENGAFQLGIGSGPSRPRPQDLPGVDGATTLAAGMIESCVLDPTGRVRCWSRGAANPPGPVRHTVRAITVAMP